MKKLNKENETKQCTIPSVSCSLTTNFLKTALSKLLTYRTPKEIIDYMDSEKVKLCIINPPYLGE